MWADEKFNFLPKYETLQVVNLRAIRRGLGIDDKVSVQIKQQRTRHLHIMMNVLSNRLLFIFQNTIAINSEKIDSDSLLFSPLKCAGPLLKRPLLPQQACHAAAAIAIAATALTTQAPQIATASVFCGTEDTAAAFTAAVVWAA